MGKANTKCVKGIDNVGNSVNEAFSWEEIAKHNKLEDCWLVVSGKVYDVTKFIPMHPAGEAAIVRKGGTDCTEDFNFHSKNARKLWEPLFIGYVQGEEPSCVIC